MSDLFASGAQPSTEYDAHAIEVLEGLEPVRRRPGMYIGGVDERAFHHLAAEVLDNSMDEAVAGHATRIEVTLEAGNRLTIVDNGRGMPVDEHPKYPGKSALEVIMTMLHSGGKFSDKAYATSGGLHGVGVSVVNALSSDTVVEVARNKEVYRQTFSRGLPTSPLMKLGAQLSHYALYGLMIVMPLIGWAMLSTAAYPVVLYGDIRLPAILPQSDSLHTLLWAAHRILAFALFALILLHVAAALVHALIRRDGVFESMAPTRPGKDTAPAE